MTRRLSTLQSLIGGLAIVLAIASPTYAQGVSATLTSTTCPGPGCLILNANTFGSVVIQINDPAAGTWTAVAEMSNDGLSYKTLTGTSSDGTTTATSWSSSNVFIVAGGSAVVRVRLSAYSSGTPLVTMRGSPASPPATISATVSASNPAAGATGSSVPPQASYTGVNIGGNNTGWTGFSVGSAKAGAVQVVDNTGTPIVSFGAGTQYTTGSTQVTPTGTGALGWDGTAVRILSTDTSGHLAVNFAATPTVNAAQSGTWNVANTGTFAVQAAQSGNFTVRNVGNAGAILDFAGQNASSPANSFLIGGQFNTTPTTITSGNASPLQLDSAGNLLVNIKAGAGSGGTALADGGSFTAGTTSATPASGFYQSSPTTCTTGTACAMGLTTNRELKVQPSQGGAALYPAAAALSDALSNPTTTQAASNNLIWDATNSVWRRWQATAGTGHAIVDIGNGGATATEASSYATGATSVAETIGFTQVFNGTTWGRLTLGQATMANSLPVAIASDQAIIPVADGATATTTNATLTCYLTSAATTNSTNCKASAGNVYAIHVTNTTTTTYFLRLYNASAAPTCSSATGFVETIPALGAPSAAGNGAINGRSTPDGQSFTTGIGFCLTGGGSSTDNTNAATGVYVTILYK